MLMVAEEAALPMPDVQQLEVAQLGGIIAAEVAAHPHRAPREKEKPTPSPSQPPASDEDEKAQASSAEEKKEEEEDGEENEGSNFFSPTGTEKEVTLLATCEQCGKEFYGHRDFGVLSNYYRHLRVHNNERPYDCDDCGRSFKTSSNLKRHRRIHQEEELPAHQQRRDRPQFKCEECGRNYASGWSLTEHQRRQHWNLREEVECPGCGQSLSSASKLRRHQLYHCIFREDDHAVEPAADNDADVEVADDEVAASQEGIQTTLSNSNEDDQSSVGHGRASESVSAAAAAASPHVDDTNDLPGATPIGTSTAAVEVEEEAPLPRMTKRTFRKRTRDAPKAENAEEDRAGDAEHSKVYFCTKSVDCEATFRSLKSLKAHIRKHHIPTPAEEEKS